MLQIQNIRENREKVLAGLSKRNKDFSKEIDLVIQLDEERRTTQVKLDDILNECNLISKEVGNLFQQGKQAEANVLREKSVGLKSKTVELRDLLGELEARQKEVLCQIPNVPNEMVKRGSTPEENENVFEEGAIPALGAHKLPHWELTEKYDLIDFELGTKITGAGFPVYKGKGAQLQRALINFFLEKAGKAGYREFMPPLMVNEDSGFGTGQLPDKEGQMYHVGIDNLYLIPTAEVPLTNLYRDVILKEEDFPVKMCGYTPCFRREAGSYGKDVRGLNRLHQFDKVEIVQIEHPDRSYQTLVTMVDHVRELLRELELPFRILRLCGGDMGFTSALTYDFEVYSAAQERWLEVSSVSNFETFQATRLKCRYKAEDGKTKQVHTLNGSALALPRIVAALLENNQTAAGIRIPKALVPFTGFSEITL